MLCISFCSKTLMQSAYGRYWYNASFREGITNPSVRISLFNIYDEITGRLIGRKYFKFSKLNLVATIVQIEVLLLPHADLSFKRLMNTGSSQWLIKG